MGTDAWWNKRARDNIHFNDTIVAKGMFQTTGGAENFLQFVKDELFLIVNKYYRTNKDSTAIVGISFGAMLS
jgi:predicted alpha/beta superfamily hydrolase